MIFKIFNKMVIFVEHNMQNNMFGDILYNILLAVYMWSPRSPMNSNETVVSRELNSCILNHFDKSIFVCRMKYVYRTGTVIDLNRYLLRFSSFIFNCIMYMGIVIIINLGNAIV